MKSKKKKPQKDKAEQKEYRLTAELETVCHFAADVKFKNTVIQLISKGKTFGIHDPTYELTTLIAELEIQAKSRFCCFKELKGECGSFEITIMNLSSGQSVKVSYGKHEDNPWYKYFESKKEALQYFKTMKSVWHAYVAKLNEMQVSIGKVPDASLNPNASLEEMFEPFFAMMKVKR